MKVLSRYADLVLIGLFIGLLWLPTVDTVFHIDWTPARSENRAMAKFPEVPAGWPKVQTYVKGLEAYFNDHFGFRKCLVQWNNRIRWSLLRENTGRSVLVGKDGWLFTMEEDSLDHYTGQLQFTPEQLHDWQVLLEKRRDWLAKRGITYLFVVAPNKESIYPEHLPDWVVKVRPETKLDQFVAYMREHSTVPVLDLRDAVRAGKKISPTYYQTDTHWNSFGGFVAYQELMRRLAREKPGVEEPLPLACFMLTNRLEPGYDLARIIGVGMTESNACSLIPKPGLPAYTDKRPPPGQLTGPRSTSNLQVKERMMVFRDSFAEFCIEFLGYHFNHVTYLWRQDLDPAAIESETPDIVVSEMVERLFNIADPQKLLAKEALN